MLIIREKTDAEINVMPGTNRLLKEREKTRPWSCHRRSIYCVSLIQAIIKKMNINFIGMSHPVPGHAFCM